MYAIYPGPFCSLGHPKRFFLFLFLIIALASILSVELYKSFLYFRVLHILTYVCMYKFTSTFPLTMENVFFSLNLAYFT